MSYYSGTSILYKSELHIVILESYLNRANVPLPPPFGLNEFIQSLSGIHIDGRIYFTKQDTLGTILTHKKI